MIAFIELDSVGGAILRRAVIVVAVAVALFFALAPFLFGCAEPTFDVAEPLAIDPPADAGAPIDPPDTRSIADAREGDGHDGAIDHDTADAAHDEGARDTSADLDSGSLADTFETGVDSTPSPDTAPTPDTTPPPTDTGCPLFDHFDPMTGDHFTSCIPSGVPGSPSTYSSALFDEEIAHVAAHFAAFTYSGATSCPESCIVREMPYGPAGTEFAWLTWCASDAGPKAGTFAWNTAGAPSCPAASAPLQWW